VIRWLGGADDPLPEARLALGRSSDAPGLVAAGGELAPARLAEAYAKGIFPWYSEGQPILWWSPDPRMVLLPAEFKLARSLKKTLRRFAAAGGCELRIDSAFRRVITACATMPREGEPGTWIVPEMIEAYCAWHDEGRAHSFETWIDGELAGGLYGVSLGCMFFGESMFASLGGRELPRVEFLRRLGVALAMPAVADWTYDLRMWRQLGIATGGSVAENAAS
jgi:leucyl/phenylalanyl-tRNA--protein transferase